MIPLMKNTFLEEDNTKKALIEFIDKAEKLSMGDTCIQFEKAFSEMQGRKFSLLFNSGGSANLAVLQAYKNLGLLKDGDRIGFSSLTWSTNVMPIIQLGFIPVAIDCNLFTLNVHLENLKSIFEKRPIKAFFATNVLGLLGDLDKIKEYCSENEILFLEDNCESLGSELFSGKAGNFSRASTFSFFVAHHMSTIEGGMVCTDDSDLDEMLRIVRANGWDRNLTYEKQTLLRKRYNIKSEFQAKYTFYDLGFNLRPTEITGFLGLYQMKFLELSIQKREENFNRILKIIKKTDDLIGLDLTHMKKISSFAIPIICKNAELREKYCHKFEKAGIEIRPIIAGNIQTQPFYRKYVKDIESLENVEFINECGFYCGNYPELSFDEVDEIINCLRK